MFSPGFAHSCTAEACDVSPWLCATPTLKTSSLNPPWTRVAGLPPCSAPSQLDTYDRIGRVYHYVRDEIAFGYNRTDDIPASEVLANGYGQCNTKGNLLVALLRGCEVLARFHGFTVHKPLQKGAIPAWLYTLSPLKLLHSWVEVLWEDAWVPLEGFIIDSQYLCALQERYPGTGSFCGYGVATDNLASPGTDWCGKPTYIQSTGIADDLGVFDHPDEFYAACGTNLKGLKRMLYEHVLRHAINRTVAHVREGRLTGYAGFLGS